MMAGRWPLGEMVVVLERGRGCLVVVIEVVENYC